MLTRSLPSLLLAALATSADAQDHWPQWRGPHGTGVARGAAPIAFGDGENVAWRVDVPGRGFSTPVIWGERIFLTTAVPTGETREGETREEHAFVVLCLDRTTGEPVWERTANVDTPHEGYHRAYGSYASYSPVTDGERLYVSFGSYGIYAYDLEGELLWERDLGVELRTRREFGEGAAPALHGDVLVQVLDQEESSSIVALDAATGEVRWRKERDEPTSWAMPLVLQRGELTEVVTAATNRVRSYALGTGELLWECGGLGANVIPTPLRHEDSVLVMSGYRDPKLMAIRLGGKGDVSGTDAVLWTSERGLSYTASPILHEGVYYTVTDRGMLSAFDAATGKPYYLEERLPRGTELKASPILAGDHVYVATESGDVHVVAKGREFRVVRTNTLADQFFVASPVVAEGRLYLRGLEQLICVGEG